MALPRVFFDFDNFGTAAAVCRQHHFLRVSPLLSMLQMRSSMRSWPKNG